MPSIVILIENVSTANAENAMLAAATFIGRPNGVKFWTYESASLPSQIEETCFETHKRELEEGS